METGSYSAIQKAQYWVKHFLGMAYIQKEPTKKPILILSRRRSGTTLLMQMIYNQPGMNYQSQPTDIWHYNPYSSQLSPNHIGEIVDISVLEEGWFKNFFDGLFSGRYRVNSQWNWFDPNYNWQVDRWVVKVLNATNLMEWFIVNVDAHILYLTRHPIPVSRSIISRKWGNIANFYLNNPVYCEHMLTPEQLRECQSIMRKGSELHRFVLEWGLSNRRVNKWMLDSKILALTYEELIIKPDLITEWMSKEMELIDLQRLRKQIDRPSKTTMAGSRAEINSGNVRKLIEGWTLKVTPDEARSVMYGVIDVLGIDLYSWDNPYPNKIYCRFGNLGK